MLGKIARLVLVLLVGVLHAQDAASYVEVRTGTLPLILTIPHGGSLRPEGIASRRFGRYFQDANTIELGERILSALQERYASTASAVICRLHRSKVDCNRELVEAAQGDPMATAVWTRFHESTDTLRRQVEKQHGFGLVLDLHGHRHAQPRVELGYLIRGPDFDHPDALLNTAEALQELTSVRELDRRSPQSFAELLRGPQSLGGLLEQRGFAAVPSPQHPSPGTAEYFSGAYTVTRHGSRLSGRVSAIQIECPWVGVRDTSANQQRFAMALVEALGVYVETHVRRSLKAAAAP